MKLGKRNYRHDLKWKMGENLHIFQGKPGWSIAGSMLQGYHLPSFILCDRTLLEFASYWGQHFTGIIGKVQVSHFSWRNRHYSERLFVFFCWRCADLKWKQKRQLCQLAHNLKTLHLSLIKTYLQHNWSLLIFVDGNIGAVNPRVCAEMPESNVWIPEK